MLKSVLNGRGGRMGKMVRVEGLVGCVFWGLALEGCVVIVLG